MHFNPTAWCPAVGALIHVGIGKQLAHSSIHFRLFNYFLHIISLMPSFPTSLAHRALLFSDLKHFLLHSVSAIHNITQNYAVSHKTTLEHCPFAELLQKKNHIWSKSRNYSEKVQLRTQDLRRNNPSLLVFIKDRHSFLSIFQHVKPGAIYILFFFMLITKKQPCCCYVEAVIKDNVNVMKLCECRKLSLTTSAWMHRL